MLVMQYVICLIVKDDIFIMSIQKDSCLNQERMLCRKCAMFYGSDSFAHLCSSCYKKQQQENVANLPVKKQEEAIIIEAQMTIETQEPAKKVQTDRKRCFECNKKMGLFGFECKCTYMFCTAHRLPEEHKCGFNHHEHEKEKLKQTLLTSNTKIHLAYTECLPCEKCGEIVVRGDLKSHVNAHADLILDNLYLGDKSCSKNRKDLIERKRVTHIVNAAAELKNYFASDGIKYLNLPLNDNKVEELISEVLRAAHFIHEAIDQGGIVFVHCAKGKSRSVSAIIMYLMVYHQLDYSESLNLIRASRPRAKPNSNYEVQLKLYYQNILKPNGH